MIFNLPATLWIYSSLLTNYECFNTASSLFHAPWNGLRPQSRPNIGEISKCLSCDNASVLAKSQNKQRAFIAITSEKIAALLGRATVPAVQSFEYFKERNAEGYMLLGVYSKNPKVGTLEKMRLRSAVKTASPEILEFLANKICLLVFIERSLKLTPDVTTTVWERNRVFEDILNAATDHRNDLRRSGLSVPEHWSQTMLFLKANDGKEEMDELRRLDAIRE